MGQVEGVLPCLPLMVLVLGYLLVASLATQEKELCTLCHSV